MGHEMVVVIAMFKLMREETWDIVFLLVRDVWTC